jgi:endonuclease/exonuclease/phosphatase family metal-dependent hydrolase
MSTPSTSRIPAHTSDAHELRAAVAAHATLDALHASAEWPRLRERLEALLDRLRLLPAASSEPARDPSRVRVAHWNIEHGNRFEALARELATHPELAGADIVTLNEVDLGMARSGNRDVAAELGTRLGLHAAWGAMFLECTRGRDDDALTAVPGDNQESLFGLAILSRWPITGARLVPLPGPEQTLFAHERMLGRFVALVGDIAHPLRPFTVATVHLEVHRTRAHRAEQMRLLLTALAGETRPVLLTGDWNTHTFDRGTRFAVPGAALALFATPSGPLAERLTHPDRGSAAEGLFEHLRAAGFEWLHSNDFAPTLGMRFARLGEVHAMPEPLRALASRGLSWAERRARLRLDWIASRGFRHEQATGRTVLDLDGPGLASDHAPITAELPL